jgi:hypothetical protein
MKVKCLKVVDGKTIVCSAEQAEMVLIKLPQPDLGEYVDHSTRVLPVMIRGKREGTNCWSWNGDTEKPTFRPSILTQANYTEIARKDFCCHSFVNDGMVQFLSDCSHKYAGKTMELLEVD